MTFSSFLFLITLALIRGNHKGWDSTEVQSEFAAAAALFVIFIFVELRQERPMLDLSFFRNPTFVGANLAGLSFAACLLTMLTYLPIYFQGGLGYGAQAAGLLMLPLAIPMIVVPRIVVSYRFTGRTLLTGGLAILSGGLLLMALAAPHFRYVDMLAGMMLAGVGGGVLNSEVVKVGITVIPPARAGMASGMSGTIRFSGVVIGFAALGAILVSRISSIVVRRPRQRTAERRCGIRPQRCHGQPCRGVECPTRAGGTARALFPQLWRWIPDHPIRGGRVCAGGIDAVLDSDQSG